MPERGPVRLLGLDLSPPTTAPLTWDGVILRVWGLLFSWLGGILLAIPVCWAYGIVLLKTHPTPPPAFYGVSTLASLPTATTCWSALFVGLTAGCVFGGLFGLFLLLAEVRRVSGPRLLVVGVVLEVLCSWSMLTRDNLLLATPCALALPVASFFGYRAVWRIRWGGN